MIQPVVPESECLMPRTANLSDQKCAARSKQVALVTEH